MLPHYKGFIFNSPKQKNKAVNFIAKHLNNKELIFFKTFN